MKEFQVSEYIWDLYGQKMADRAIYNLLSVLLCLNLINAEIYHYANNCSTKLLGLKDPYE